MVISANPQDLLHYAEASSRLDERLQSEANNVSRVLEQFNSCCTEIQAGVDVHLAADLLDLVRSAEEQNRWVREVGINFENADRDRAFIEGAWSVFSGFPFNVVGPSILGTGAAIASH